MEHLDSPIDPRLNFGSEPIYPHPPNAAPRLAGPLPPPQYHRSPHDAIPPPPQLYMPQTPQSAGNLTDDGGAGALDSGDYAKRPRACEACRGLKVKCQPDDSNPDGPCKRCIKANRNCVVTAPSRKRQKKSDTRVAELEKKIDALTATLQATKSDSVPTVQGNETGFERPSPNIQPRPHPYEQVTNGGYNSSPYPNRSEQRVSSNEWSPFPKSEIDILKPNAVPMVMAGQKRKHAELRKPSSISVSGIGKRSFLGGNDESSAQKTPQVHKYADVVDRGMITMEVATLMFNNYVDKMSPHMPAVVFPLNTTAAEIRKSKPTLFLSILSASSGTSHPDEQKPLTKELMSIFAERIICNGEKTLELVQALHISTLWYWPPEHFEELKFYQLIHIASVMAIDIGMGKRNKSNKPKAAPLWRDHPWRRTPFPDPESIEARRTWLGCYFLCCNASMGLRRPNLIRWSSFMAECVDVLESSPEAAPTDKSLCQWVRSQRIAEEIGIQFSMDDPMASVSITDAKVQYALKGFEHDLAKWSAQIPVDVQTPSLKLTEHVVNLYMHEVAMHVDHNVDEFKPPFTEATIRGTGETPKSLTPDRISALSICLTSIDGIFDTFLKFDIETIRCLPIAHFVRVAYAVVVLIKMYFAAATPGSELGKVINKDNMKVEQYLDGLVDIFRASAAAEKSRPAAKFLMVLIMLKTWFNHQSEGKAVQSKIAEFASTKGTGPFDRKTQRAVVIKPGYSPPDNTPLQLLSEVAAGNSGSRPEGSNQYNGATSWQQTQQQVYPTYDAALQIQNFPGYVNGAFDPSYGVDNIMGEGFEQAMGMTLGVGDFWSYNDDAFGAMMDSVGSNNAQFDGA